MRRSATLLVTQVLSVAHSVNSFTPSTSCSLRPSLNCLGANGLRPFLPSALGNRFVMSSHSAEKVALANKISSGSKAPIPVPGDSGAIQAAVTNNVEGLKAVSEGEIDVADNTGNSPLIWAADRGNKEAVKFLLERPSNAVDLARKGYLGNSALSRAARQGHVEVVRMLLQAANERKLSLPGDDSVGARALGNVHNDKLQYAMHFAAFKRQPAVVQLMLEMGLDTMVLDRKGRTPAEDTDVAEIREMIVASRS